jgi:tRNA(adenine34) deaminase
MDYEIYMKLALLEAETALTAGEFPVGCVIIHDGKTVATGSRVSSTQLDKNELDHAEMLALKRFVRERPDLGGKDTTVFSTLEPCLMCYSALIVNGITRIVYAYEDVFGGGTDLALSNRKPFYQNMQIQIVPGILRREALALFKAYFSNPKHDYLRETLLAKHALGEL